MAPRAMPRPGARAGRALLLLLPLLALALAPSASAQAYKRFKPPVGISAAGVTKKVPQLKMAFGGALQGPQHQQGARAPRCRRASTAPLPATPQGGPVRGGGGGEFPDAAQAGSAGPPVHPLVFRAHRPACVHPHRRGAAAAAQHACLQSEQRLSEPCRANRGSSAISLPGGKASVALPCASGAGCSPQTDGPAPSLGPPTADSRRTRLPTLKSHSRRVTAFT